MTLTPYLGGRRLMTMAAAVGAAGLVVTALGAVVGDPRRVLYAYLVAFVYWLGLALGALLLLGALHASNARWPVVLRRFLEHLPAVIPLFVVLFVPILLGRGHLFPWVDPHGLEGEVLHAVEHKKPWLNVPFFVVRAAIYFACWILVAHLLRAWSLRQDAVGGHDLTRRQRALGAGSLPFVALTLTFAAFDWMMSLDPRFFSTIFGVYWFAGSFVGAFAVVIIAANATRVDPNQFGAHMNTEHFHALGKFLLAFTAFWAYVAFSQFMLIWIANVPEEVPWYILRIEGGWKAVGVFLALFHFLVPFFLLMNRAITRVPGRLAKVAAWILFVHWIDLYWLVMPHLDPGGPRPSLWDLSAFVGVGGVTVAFALVRMRGTVAVPVRDPYLEDSLRYLPQ
ncbi:hypothetical protein [Anaeromyxobacter sp. PSR-1]|uniref:hypothetical protein n=1 Tax=Anaeromyxobacter sp. PSR-1 TaxID=1300915 RepID=UPI0005E5005A|nr:hypothetical protein [Anaeromyxobacter sp. PSR-1]GAO02020.1 hypothetical protein PSR1_00887 [Anaeromyxobacter sp. PSR-1]